MDDSDGSEHPLLHMEQGVIRHVYSFLNPRPPVAADAVPATHITLRTAHPILTNAQLRLNCVLARRTPENQEPGSFARVSSLMYDDDVQSGRALFYALMQNRSDATVCDLINMNPLALTMINTNHDTPLLVALYKKRNFQVVQHMVKINRDVIMYKRNNVDSPLMCAIRPNVDLRILAILIDENGAVLRQRNSSHMLPVSIAIEKGCHVDVLKMLVYPDCIDIYDRPPEGLKASMPLHLAVDNPKWCPIEVVEFLVQANQAALLMTNSRGLTALHIAAGRRPAQDLDVQVIQFLAQQAPAARTMLSSSGKSPFRLAVSSYYKSWKCRDKFDDMAAILLALRDDDETVLIHPSMRGYIPLIKACVYGSMVHPAVMRVLIGTKHATTTMTTPEELKTALHYMVNSTGHNMLDSMECIQMLCANTTVFTMRDHKGCTPLLSSLWYSADIDVVKALTPSTHQSVLGIPNNDGNLPLHLAIIAKAGDDVLTRLMGCKEMTCGHRNKQGNRAIDIAVKYPGFDMARMSLFMYPGIDMISPEDQPYTILHQALEHGAHPTVIAYLIQVGPSMLGVKSHAGHIPLMTAMNAKIKVGHAWQSMWPDEMILSLAQQTHAVSAKIIPSCRCVFQETTGRRSGDYVGCSVLHLALKTCRPFGVIRCIVDMDVDALLSTQPAYSYSLVTFEYYDKDLHDQWRRPPFTHLLPFHRALWYGAPIDILKYLAEKHPTSDLFESADIFNNTALHIAIRQQRRKELYPHLKESSLTVDTVRYLIDAGEMALIMPDKHGNTPLHLAIAVESNAEIVQLVVEACTPPDAMYRNCVAMVDMACELAFSMQNRDLHTPLHLALQKYICNVPPAYIMRPCPRAMLVQDKDGRTPMHWMLLRFCTEIDVDNVLQLLRMQPGVLLIQDGLGCTPLHTLLQNLERYMYRNMPADWQENIARYLTGTTPGLLTREQSKQLMRLTDAANRTPLQYYLEKFRQRDEPYFFEVLGRELGRIHSCL